MATKRKPKRSRNEIAAGPRKQDLFKGRSNTPRLSHHKKRSGWFQARAAWPLREASIANLVHERNRMKAAMPAAAGVKWENIGPTNIGGRMTSLVCHPKFPDRIWAGAAGGGVWQSGDAGVTWHTTWSQQDVLNIGALAIDPKNPSRIYCGTGEANLSADSYPGVGLYVSTDGGNSWNPLASSDATGIPTRIGVIAIDPFDSKHIRLGGVGFGEVSPRPNDYGGMYVSHDAGKSWKRESFISASNYWCHSIVFDPVNRGTLFAGFTQNGSANGIWSSQDGGTTWVQAKKGLPPPESFGRTTLALCASQPSALYAFAENALSTKADLLLGVFRSTDGGKSWADVAGTYFAGEGQISYGNTIVVHPKDPSTVLCGGVDLHLTRNGGTTWTKVTRWDADTSKPNYAHADHHHLLIPDAAPDRVYDPNDGGLSVSDDGGRTWTTRSDGLDISMFYDMDIAQTDGRCFGGGMQDVGSWVTSEGGGASFVSVLGGDGGWMVYDPKDATHLYASYYNLGIFRHRVRWTDVSPPAPKAEQNAIWMAYITMDPNNSNIVFTGSKRIWRTTNDGAKWTPVSPVLDDSPITAIEIAEADSKRIYVGTNNGGFFRSSDGGNTWSADLSGSTLPGYQITRIDSTRKLGRDTIFVTVANVGKSHVYLSHDGGNSWVDVDNRQLPDVPHNAVVIRPDDPSTVYVANDAGVFVSPDSGASWKNMTANIPNAMVVDLVIQRKDRTLTAATYGRGLWQMQM